MNRLARAAPKVSVLRWALLFLWTVALAMAEPTPTPSTPPTPTTSPSPAASPSSKKTDATPTPPQQPKQLPQSILPARVNMRALETLPIHNRGHVDSFFLFCSQRLTEITGSRSYDGSIYGELSAQTVIVSMWLNPESWKDQPLIALKDPELRAALELPGGGTRASYSQLQGPNRLRELFADARATLANPDELTSLQSNVLELVARMDAFRGVIDQGDLRFVPPVNGGQWLTIREASGAYPGPLGQSLEETVERMKRAFQNADPYHFEGAVQAFVDTLRRLNPQTYPPPETFVFDVWITRMDLGWWAGLLLAIAALVIMLTFQRRRGVGYVVSCGLCGVACVLLLVEMIGESRVQHVNFLASFLRSFYLLPFVIAAVGLLLDLCCRKRYVLLGAAVVTSVWLLLHSFSL